jgi:phosphonate transport system permease protein
MMTRHGISDDTRLEAARERWPWLFATPLAQRVRTYGAWLLLAGATIYSLWHTGFFDIARLIAGLGKLGWLLGFMFPPAANGWFLDFCEGILETLGMAFLGTLFAALIALPFGFLGARNVVTSAVIHFSLRRVFDCLRGVDTLIWALVFVNVVGLGPFAGILAIVVSDLGTFAKLFAEAIENIDRKQVEGVRSTGASEIEVMRFGILPQVIPVILSQVLYYFESNTRSATILGIVGAGGIGLQLSDRIRVNNWDEACLIIIMILITVSIIDHLSKLARLRIIQAQEYRP